MSPNASRTQLLRRVLTGALCATGAVGLFAANAAPSMAATSSPAAIHSGLYKTWPAAQRAARFGLLRPGSTDGLKMQSQGIRVLGCQGGANVIALYGPVSGRGRLIALLQDDARGAQACENPGEGKALGRYKVDGTTATLYGACGIPGSPSCSAPHQYYWLVWTRHGRYYQVFTHDLTRAQNVRIARHLHKVS
jgi:hypothetical protein